MPNNPKRCSGAPISVITAEKTMVKRRVSGKPVLALLGPTIHPRAREIDRKRKPASLLGGSRGGGFGDILGFSQPIL